MSAAAHIPTSPPTTSLSSASWSCSCPTCPPRSTASICLRAGSESLTHHQGELQPLALPLNPPPSLPPSHYQLFPPPHERRKTKTQPVKYSYSKVWPTGISYNVIDTLYFSLFLSLFFFFLTAQFSPGHVSHFVFGTPFPPPNSPTLLLSFKLEGMVAHSGLSHGALFCF